VTGVEPSEPMLEVARRRPGGERVRWIRGDATQLSGSLADLALMTGHVAQIFLDDESWYATLAATHRALRPGGRVAFDSRNPATRPWAEWTPEASRRQIDDAAGDRVDVWHELLDVRGDRVRFATHYRFASPAEELQSTGELRFRSQAELTHSLTEAGFAVEHLFGDWERGGVHDLSAELIVVAVRA
jgi:SAM-dependent methyltransferase